MQNTLTLFAHLKSTLYPVNLHLLPILYDSDTLYHFRKRFAMSKSQAKIRQVNSCIIFFNSSTHHKRMIMRATLASTKDLKKCSK